MFSFVLIRVLVVDKTFLILRRTDVKQGAKMLVPFFAFKAVFKLAACESQVFCCMKHLPRANGFEINPTKRRASAAKATRKAHLIYGTVKRQEKRGEKTGYEKDRCEKTCGDQEAHRVKNSRQRT